MFVYLNPSIEALRNTVETSRRRHQTLHRWTSTLSTKEELSAFLQAELKGPQGWRKGINRIKNKPIFKSFRPPRIIQARAPEKIILLFQ